MSARPTLPRVALLALLLALSSFASAQTTARRPVASGDVTGVDLQLEGALVAPRGGTLRFPVAAVEVVGLRDLRPAPRATLRVASSLSRDRSIELVLDARGRGVLEIPVPVDAPPAFRLQLELHHRGSILRRFELDVQTGDPEVLDLEILPARVFPRSPFVIVGRALEHVTGHALANVEVEVACSDVAGPLGRPITLHTDRAGAFAHRFELPPNARLGHLECRATTARTDSRQPLVALVGTELVAREAPALLVSLAPSKVVASPGETIELTLVVRRPDGRPVRRATAFVPGLSREETIRVSTDERGVAHLSYRLPNIGAPFVDVPIRVEVEKAGFGHGDATTSVRATSVDYAGEASVEGGRLVPELGGRVFARAVRIDGHPAPAGTPVVLRGARIAGELRASTDEAGVAVFDVRLAPAPRATDEGADECGGEAATSLALTIGEGERAAEVRTCAALDPDGLVRVRLGSSRVVAGGALAVHLDRVRAVAGAPVAITLLATDGASRPVTTLVVDGRTNDVSLPVPRDVTGRVTVRARPLHGAASVELRGGSAMAEVSPGPTFRASARLDSETGDVRVEVTGDSEAPLSAIAVALPIDELRLARGELAPGTRWLVPRQQPTRAIDLPDSVLAAALARDVPIDRGAPFVLLAGVVTPVPAPADPASTGLLRDPWRSRARFVEGRLALLFRAIEDFVDASVPGRPDDVVSFTNGRARFNDAILASVSSEGALGGEGATGLGGDPLSIEQLSRLDPSFTYDSVAHRITRQRLFLLLLELRAYVRTRGLDLPWARPGEPAQWLRDLAENPDGAYGDVSPRTLVDAWGRPFALRVAARPRFTALVPVPGYELVSAGADGRFGTGDDVWDPTERVLPAGSLYAEAVGENALVARLRGVELGRATLASVRDAFSVGGAAIPYTNDDGSVGPIGERTPLPTIVDVDPEALSLRRVTDTIPSVLEGPIALDAPRALRLALPDEPRTWGVSVLLFAPDGTRREAIASGAVGHPFLVTARLPPSVREGDRVSVEVPITNVSSTDRTARVSLAGTGCLRAEGPSELGIAAGRVSVVPVTLVGTCVGHGRLLLTATDARGRALTSLDAELSVVSALRPTRARTTALLDHGAVTLPLRVPDGALASTGRLVLVTPAHAADSPELADLRGRDPALVAWFEATVGRPLDPELRASLLRSLGEGPDLPTTSLSRATAIVALATLVDDAQAAQRRVELVAMLSSFAPFELTTPVVANTRTHAALVAALAATGTTDASATPGDAIGAYVSASLPFLRQALRDFPDDGSTLAFASAALLLANPDDAHGLAMLERASAQRMRPAGRASRRARRRSGSAPGATLVCPGEGRPRGDAVAATFALALAAHQAGREALAHDLRSCAVAELPIAGTGGEATFWYLAAAAYGALGTSDEPAAKVVVDGHAVEVDLSSGRAIHAIALRAGERHEARVESRGQAALLVGVEAGFVTPFVVEGEGPLDVSIAGDVGHEGSVAALELSITARVAVGDGVVDLFLPSGVVADEALLASLGHNGFVRTAELRGPSALRLRLRPIGSGVTFAIPLPFELRAHGEVRGFATVAYSASTPALRIVHPDVAVTILPSDED